MQKRVYGHAKQGAAFGHTKIQGKSLLVRGLNVLAATISTPLAAPVIAGTRLRGGSAASARGAASMITEAVGTARAAGCTGDAGRADGLGVLRSPAVLGAVRQAGAFFSVTVRMDPKVRAAIAAIPEDAWTPIRYPRAIWDDQLRRWVSDAQVAETEYTAFTSRKGQAITARLIVRRVRDLNPKAAAGQGELFTAWRYHAVFTDSPFAMLQAEEHHRDHAQVEQVFADLTDGPLAHLPSGSFPANAAWLALAAISHNLLRAAGPWPACLRQGQRGHPAPRPHRRRRPHRPPRPRPPHLAPARRLAPRAPNGPASSRPPAARPPPRPDQPRPGHRTPRPHAATRQTASQHPRQGPGTSRRTRERQENHAHPRPKITSRPATRKRSPEFTRWIEA